MRATSPVPGGMSTTSTSMGPQEVWLQNWRMAPASTGPRQSTGSFSWARSMLALMTLMPRGPTAGRKRSPMVVACRPPRPSMRGTEGPVMSASRIPTLRPRRASSTARLQETRDLPTPPLPETTPTTHATSERGCCSNLWGAPPSLSVEPSFLEQAMGPPSLSRCVHSAHSTSVRGPAPSGPGRRAREEEGPAPREGVPGPGGAPPPSLGKVRTGRRRPRRPRSR